MPSLTYSAAAVSLFLASGLASPAHAALLSRLGGLAYYDTATNLTWLANADYGYGSTYDSADGLTDGRMTWANANAWAASLTIDGVKNWRLPETNPVNGTSYNYASTYDGSTDVGYNISAPGTVSAGSTASEMAHMYYDTLGNLAYYDTSGSPQTGYGPINTGPFSNIQPDAYWSATVYSGYTTSAWLFSFASGGQGGNQETGSWSAWAVHSGDVSAVPVPAAFSLFGSGLLGLVSVGTRRRR